MTLKEKIIVLKTFKHGESDIIVHGLNSLGARMNFFARGGMKSRKRFAGGILEPLHYIEVTYKVSRSNEADPLHTLLEAQMLREFAKLRTDYNRLEAALYMLKLVHKLGQQGVVDSPELFNLLGNALQAAETSGNLDKLKLHFELKVMAAQGVLPHEEGFHNWLNTSLAKHEQIPAPHTQYMLVHAQVHEHLRHYLGPI
ncbi:MAG: DNA repair protein RecO [Bdellovibrionales bacterium]|nr:DNA repair protein RecO [Bdellovibrionales bacterium]